MNCELIGPAHQPEPTHQQIATNGLMSSTEPSAHLSNVKETEVVRFQASAGVQMMSLLFYVVIQRSPVVGYRFSGTAYQSRLQLSTYAA